MTDSGQVDEMERATGRVRLGSADARAYPVSADDTVWMQFSGQTDVSSTRCVEAGKLRVRVVSMQDFAHYSEFRCLLRGQLGLLRHPVRPVSVYLPRSTGGERV